MFRQRLVACTRALSGPARRCRQTPRQPARTVVTARLKRLLFIRWKAAAIAYRERQTALLALYRAGDRDLSNKRIYRGPIDDALERAAWLRKRRRLKQA